MNGKFVKEFLNKENIFAVIGVSRNQKKYGHKIYKDLKEADYKVYAINPNINEILGDKCYHSLKELPEKPDVVDIVVPPKITEKILIECKELNIDKVWLQPGSENENAIGFCKKNNIKILYGICVMIERRKPKIE